MKTICAHPRVILNSKALDKLLQGWQLVINYKFVPIFRFNNRFLNKGFFIKDLHVQKWYGKFPLRSDFDNEYDFIRDYHSYCERAVDGSWVVSCKGETIPLYLLVPCGKCELCINSKRNEWSLRSVLESQYYHYPPLFFSLTYDDDHCDGSLHKRHVQLFIKRLRQRFIRGSEKFQRPEFSLRYFICGEYGSKKGRPHYHVQLWNFPDYGDCKTTIRKVSEIITDTWCNGDFGSDYTDSEGKPGKDLHIEYARGAGYYMTKYSTKSFDEDDKSFLCREKPFHLFSRKPALGMTPYFYNTILPQFHEHPEVSHVDFFDLHEGGRLTSCNLPRSIKAKVYPCYSEAMPSQDFQTCDRKFYTTFRPELNRYLNKLQTWLYNVQWLKLKINRKDFYYTDYQRALFEKYTLPFVDIVARWQLTLKDHFAWLDPVIERCGISRPPFHSVVEINQAFEDISFPYEKFSEFYYRCMNIPDEDIEVTKYRLKMTELHKQKRLMITPIDTDVTQLLFNVREKNKKEKSKEIF